ncbi:MAG: sulfatase family protein [Actinomycetota bacterium]
MPPRTGITTRPSAWGALAILVVGATIVSGPVERPFGAPRGHAAVDAPNVVLIVTDDQRWDTLSSMRGVQRVLAAPGTTFRNAFVSNSLCCPSRASILTGAYSHSTGVYTNGGEDGFQAFDDGSTLAMWLDSAGYRTALIGKYFNGAWPVEYIPPGWDRWVTFRGSQRLYYDYALSVQGRSRSFGSAASDYSTSVLGGYAERFIRGADAADPLFLMLTPFAPHAPRIAGPGDSADVLDPWVPGPNLPEADVSDKPDHIRELATRTHGPHARALWAQQVKALRAVDGMVVDVVRALRETGRLHDTIIVFTADNGIALGEHRWNYKLVPYEESIRVPMVMRYDPLTEGATPRAMALNVDIAPTVTDLAGISAPGAEGRSLVPVLSGARKSVRSSFLLEHEQYRAASGGADPPTFCGMRTHRHLFVRYATGEEELYDLRRDPYELRNLAEVSTYEVRLERLRSRARALCRPRPPGFSWTT